MSMTLIEVFDKELSHLKFNQSLATALYKFQVAFINKNEEHMAFFGGKLFGVQIVRFSEQDFNKFFNDIINIDPVKLRNIVIKEVDDINENFKVSSDIFNLICFYLIHKFLITPLLDEKKRERAALDIALIFNYRWIAAFIRDYLRFPVDIKLAQATYANLSNRFIIKKVANWQEVMVYRAQEMLSDDGIHKETFIKFNNDLNIVYAINDSQSRIRDMVKNIMGEMKKAQINGERIYTTGSTMIDADGEDTIKDRVHGLETYTTYILSVLPDKHSFIKTELIDVVSRVMPTMQERSFIKLLTWMSIHHHDHPEIEKIIRSILIHSFNYLLDNGYVLKNSKDLPGLLTKLKGVYVSSRSSDPDLLQLRTMGTELISLAIGKTNEQTVAAIRTGLFLYICLRSYTKHYYGG